jgi:DNA repair protein RadC
MDSYRIPKYKISLVRDGSICAERPTVSSAAGVYKAVRSYFADHDREEMIVVLLDAKHRINGINSVSIGSLTLSIVHPREIFKAAILANSSAIIAVHNHPSGDPTPSGEDLALTKRLKNAGEILGIPLLDHLVIGFNSYNSFADNGWL